MKAGCLAVSIRSNDFRTRSHQRKLPEPTDISREVFETGKQLFGELWDGHTPLRLLGMSLTDLTHGEAAQLSMFSDADREKARRLDRAYDAINSKFGSSAIMRGSSIQSGLEVGKKYRAQLEQKKKRD